MTKPPYRVPLMSEVAALPWNGFNVVSTFAGCGGSSTGYRMAGFRVRWASEFIDAARETYLANARPGTAVDGRDIREVSPADILAATGLSAGELDVFDGSPPCSSFSTAGRREKAWGTVKKYSDKEQRADDLFFEYARLIDGLRPRVFVAENVSGLVKGTAKGYFLEILAALKRPGYRVVAKLLDAQWLGVPQARQRLIFVGVREDLGLDPVHPKPLPFRYSIRDALGGLAGDVEPETDISRFAIGAEWEKIGVGGQSEKYFQLVRPDPDGPSPTITAAGGGGSIAGVTHPTEKRKFTIAELRRICGFPDDFALTGTYAQQWERLGRAVPPIMMSHVAATVRDQILLPLQQKGPAA
jgi:DNA (cytosine-5)-methyltransferase 1